MLDKQLLVRRAGRALARCGLVNAYGHCSVRIDDSSFLVSAPKPLGLLLPSDLGSVVNVEGPLPQNVLGEVRAHQQIYKRRPDVGGICRIMPPNIASVAALGRTPEVRHGFGSYFWPRAPFYNDSGLLRSDERASALAETLGAARAVIMKGNGAVVAGETLEEAVVLAWYLEDAARVELDVMKTGIAGADMIYIQRESEERATFVGRPVERMWDFLTAGDMEPAL
jgi:HCOMODA/2-hydroxy-3-carboxy-muconic semialdehyde decarboxylase